MHSLHRDDLALRSDDTPGRAMASGVGAPQSQPPRRVQRPRERAGIDGALAEHSPWERSFEKLERQAPPAEQLTCCAELKQGRLHSSMAWFAVPLAGGDRCDDRKAAADPTRRFSALWALPMENPCLDRLEYKRPCGGSFGCKLGAALEVRPQCRYNANEAWFGA